MGAVKVVFLSLLFVAFAFIIHLTLSANTFGRVHNQSPGQCITFKMNGSEDIILLPKINHAIVTSGLSLMAAKFAPNRGALYVLKMDVKQSTPTEIKFTDNYLEDHPHFNPHGISYWVDETTDEILLYVICHWEDHRDSVDMFLYDPKSLSVKFLKRFHDALLSNLNNLVVIGREEFYTTRWHYFTNSILFQIEQLFRLPLNSVVYYDGNRETGRVVIDGLRSCNGINKANNGRYIYVANSLAEEVVAYTRLEDNSLMAVQSITIPLYVDNVSVDSVTGHLWVAVFVKCMDFPKYIRNTSFPFASQTLHIAINEQSDSPFTGALTEQVFLSDSHGAISTALYTNGHLLLGSVLGDMHMCKVNYLMY